MIVDNPLWNLLIYITIISASFITVMYFLDKILKLLPYLRKILRSIYNNLYLYLLPFPVVYLLYYKFYYVPDEKRFFLGFEVAEFIKSLSILFFSGGVFSATVKLINNLVVFKKNFQKVILSDDFDEMLRNKFQILSLSDEYLLKRNDLHDIWIRVTTCKYQQKFPALKDAIVNKMENDFFNERMLKYYYRNFNIQVNLELIEDDLVKITEISNFTVMAETISPVELVFKVSSTTDEVENDVIYTKIIEDACKVDEMKLPLEVVPQLPESKVKEYKADLAGKKQYDIKRKVEMTQRISEDPIFSFTSSIIIDHMTVNLQSCQSLELAFSKVGKNIFTEDNHINAGLSYASREVLLPGEKFKVFMHKKS